MQIEDAVMLLVLDHVVVAMGTHSHDPQVTHWGSKVIAHAASNGKDPPKHNKKLTMKVCFGSDG